MADQVDDSEAVGGLNHPRAVPAGAAAVVAVLGGGYVAAQMMSDIASLRIIEVLGWSVDAGTLVYPITFTLRDLIHKTSGKRAARALIFTAAGVNLVMAGLFWLVARLPPAPSIGAQVEFGHVLEPVWRIVFASILAEVIAELIDTEVYARWVERFGSKWQWGRVLSSNAVAVPIDSAVFTTLAFLGVFPGSVLGEIFIANVLAKGLVTLASIPLIYTVRPRRLVE